MSFDLNKKSYSALSAIALAGPLMMGMLPWLLSTKEAPVTDEELLLHKEIESHVRSAEWTMMQAEHLRGWVECLEKDIQLYSIKSEEVHSSLRVHQAMMERYANMTSEHLKLADEKQALYDGMRTKTKAEHTKTMNRSSAASRLGINKYTRCIGSGDKTRVDCAEMAAFAVNGTNVLTHCKKHATEAGIEKFDDPIELLKIVEDNAYEIDKETP